MFIYLSKKVSSQLSDTAHWPQVRQEDLVLGNSYPPCLVDRYSQ